MGQNANRPIETQKVTSNPTPKATPNAIVTPISKINIIGINTNLKTNSKSNTTINTNSSSNSDRQAIASRGKSFSLH